MSEEETKIKALDKMLQELSTEHGAVEDVVHNWLCTQNDCELFTGILKDGRTISGSISYCSSQARKMADLGDVAMVPDETVWKWVREYFVSDEIKIEPVVAKVEVGTSEKASQKAKKVATKKPKKQPEEEEQLDLFDFL